MAQHKVHTNSMMALYQHDLASQDADREPMTTTPTNSVNRRAFIAAGAVAIPSAALARTTSFASVSSTADMDFEDLMKAAGNNLKPMRDLMRLLDNPVMRQEIAYLANQVTINLAQAVDVADQAPIPERSKAKYADDKETFTKDLRIKLLEAVSASTALARQAWLGNEEEIRSLYNSLRTIRKDGHDEFEEEH